jgi:UDP-glucose 4-epimerase
VALRYCNVAGASAERGECWREETHLIPRALDTASGKLPQLESFGADYPMPDRSCVRDYIHVLDIADSHLRALEEIERVSGDVFNVAISSQLFQFGSAAHGGTRHRAQDCARALSAAYQIFARAGCQQ